MSNVTCKICGLETCNVAAYRRNVVRARADCRRATAYADKCHGDALRDAEAAEEVAEVAELSGANTETKLLPVKLLDGMDEGLPRQILMWYGMSQTPTADKLYTHLRSGGPDAPEWLKRMIPPGSYCPPKMAVLAALWRSMAERYPDHVNKDSNEDA